MHISDTSIYIYIHILQINNEQIKNTSIHKVKGTCLYMNFSLSLFLSMSFYLKDLDLFIVLTT